VLELLDGATDAHVIVAWAGLNDVLRGLMAFARSGGNLRLVVGRDFNGTDPRAVRRVFDAAPTSIRWGFKPRRGIFHPKVYVFHRPDRVDAIVGSANLTASALHHNTEAVVHLSGSSAAMRDVHAFVENAWGAADEIDEASLAAYEQSWSEHRREQEAAQDSIAAQDTASTERRDAAARADRLVGRFLGWEWEEYVEQIQRFAELWVPFGQSLEELLDMLDEVPPLLDRPIRKLNKLERLALLGQWSEAFPNAGWLGRMSAAGLARHRLVEDDEPSAELQRAVYAAIRGIPRGQQLPAQDVVARAYEDLRALDGVGHAIATRFLTLRRPDVFLSVNSASLAGLSQILNVPESRLMTWAGYSEGLRRLWNAPWWKTPKPSDPFEQKLAHNRAALVDFLVYRPTSGRHPHEELL